MTENPNAAAKKPGRGRKLGIGAGIALGLLVVLYFVVTSAAFLKGFVLPGVGDAIHAKVTVEDASLSPFSSVRLRGLKVTTTGSEPLLQVAEVRTGYSLIGMLGGNINVGEAVMVEPVINIIQQFDGTKVTSNLDPILAELNKPRPPKAKSPPPKLDIKNIALQNATLRFTSIAKDGTRQFVELKNINLTLDQLKNGGAGKLTLGADIKTEAGHTPGASTNDTLSAKLSGSLDLALTADLLPQTLGGKIQLDVPQAGGALKELTGLAATLDCNLTPTELKQLALSFTRGGQAFGQIHASGPLNMEKKEGKLKLEIVSIDRNVLNLAGAVAGMDFGRTRLDSANEVTLAQGGQSVSVAGKLTASQFSVTQRGQGTVPLDLTVDYNVAADRSAKTLLISAFSLTGQQGGRPLLRGSLTKPMRVGYGVAVTTSGGAPTSATVSLSTDSSLAMEDSALEFALTDLNLADWKAFVGDLAPAGKVNVKANVLAQQAGKKVTAKMDARVDDLSVKAGANLVEGVAVTVVADAKVDNFTEVELSSFKLDMSLKRQSALTTSSSAKYSLATGNAELQTVLSVNLPAAAPFAGSSGLVLTSGKADLDARVTQQVTQQAGKPNVVQSVKGNLKIANVSGRLAVAKLADLGATFTSELAVAGQVLTINKLGGEFNQAGKQGGSLEVTGNYDLAKASGQVALKLTDLNENILQPFLAAALGGQQHSISVNANATARCDAKGESAVQADFQVGNLKVTGPKGQFPETPLVAQFKLDAGVKSQVMNLRQFQISLTPTAKAKNTLQMTGQLDMTQVSAMKANFKMQSESLDLTPYYDLIDNPGTAKAGAAKTPATTQAVTSPEPIVNLEPPATTLPFRDSAFDVTIGKLYLRDLTFTDFVLNTRAEGGRVQIKPMQLALNGAPIRSDIDLNLGVPGYQYDASFKAVKVPLEPLANTFVPAYRGLVKADMNVDVAVKGSGVTGVNLRKNLEGQILFTLTNANIQVGKMASENFGGGNMGKIAKGTLTVVAYGLQVPEILTAPLDWVNAQVKLGQGNIDLREFAAHSPVVLVETSGRIPIAEVLDNSPLNFPVHISLPEAFAKKFSFTRTSPPGGYQKLPDFVKLEGTVGKPEAKTDKLVIVGLTATGVSGALGGRAGGALGTLGGLITGQHPSTNPPPAGSVQTNNPTTPSPATNAPPTKKKFDLFKSVVDELGKDKNKDKK
jgi:hypothetical protein